MSIEFIRPNAAQVDRLVSGIEHQNILLSRLVPAGSATPVAELHEIHNIVKAGDAPKVYDYGDQIFLNYNDGSNGYVLPWDVVHFGNFELQDGETVPGMVIQSHFAMQGVQFSASQAAYVCETALAPGNYYFTIGTNLGTHCVAGSTYSFTTTVEIPAGGQIVIGTNTNFYQWGAPDVAAANWRVYTFASSESETPLETLSLTAGATGTSLFTLSSNTKFGAGMTNLQSAAYGYGRWSHSANRQFYNSAAAMGAWWAAQHPEDRPPQQLSSMRGFMAGFDEEFLNIIRPTKVRTALNTVSDVDIGTYEDTFDTFFLPSLEQEYIAPQLANTEGEYWEYWKRRLGLTAPQEQGAAGTNPAHIRYAYNAQTSAQNCRLRSCCRGNANGAWTVYPAGYASYNGAAFAHRGCPACVIC